MENETSSFTMIVVALVSLLLGAIVRAFVISSLWNWFIVPALNMPEIGMGTAYGISLLASLFTTPPSSQEYQGLEWGEMVGKMVAFLVGAPLLTLGLGWLVHAFMT